MHIKTLKNTETVQLVNYPFENSKEVCWILSNEEEVELINYQKNKMLVICHNEDLEHQVNKLHTILKYHDIFDKRIPTIGMLSNEQTAIKELTEISLKDHWYFSIYDSYNRSETCKEKTNFLFDDISLIIYPSVLFPIYYSCWAFVNYLTNEVFTSKASDVLEMFAGSGNIGLLLKKRGLAENVSYSDINFWSKKSIEETMESDPSLKGKVWLSECFSTIPPTEKYDIIIGNPPHTDKPLETIEMLPGCDPQWKIHWKFFEQAVDYLREKGKIILIENKYSSVNNSVFNALEEKYTYFKIKKKTDLPNHLCYIIEIEKK